MASMRDRLRRLEEARAARARVTSTGRVEPLERHCRMIEHVRQFGLDAPLPAHLTTRNVEEEIEAIESLRSSGSGWTENPDAIAFLEAWEEDVRGA